MDERTPTPPSRADDIILWTGRIVLGLGLVELVRGIVSAPSGTITIHPAGIIAGLLILHGSVKVRGVVRWLALLCAGSTVLMFFCAFVLPPAGLVVAQLRLYPAAFANNVLDLLLTTAIELVTCIGLSHREVQATQSRDGRPPASAGIPLALGVAFALAGYAFMTHMLSGPDARYAEQLASARLGPGYRYHVDGISYGVGATREVRATVQAWNDHELLQVPVSWPRE